MTADPQHRSAVARLAVAALAVVVVASCAGGQAPAPTAAGPAAGVSQAVGAQYDSVHVYVEPGQLDAFVRSWLATFGGSAKPQAVVTVTPTPSQTKSQLILSPVGTISAFEFTTAVPYPFGSERTGWLMADFDAGVQQARDAGAAVVVEPFPDPIGRDTVIEFPGGVNAQLYWHTTAPSYPPLASVPDNRIYLPAARVDQFLKSYLQFTHGRIDTDAATADGVLIGKPGTTFRRIRLTSPFGDTIIAVTDGQLPYPYGRELAGYRVADVSAVIAKAVAAGASVLGAPVRSGSTTSAMLQWPGGYIAELHSD
ncbi:glyoxalase [Mycolicibacterium mucogenicum]|uniref:glyoxalase n=1 Tax=Mycolicibacterium mucogenicum TaxID=56689 RepID=UPI00226A3FE9|nr:glyoxalase [Mycolicibacterium mucogenicum]MCX8562415.1 glyoxalase [Mycolicibacterium mucogenicum]